MKKKIITILTVINICIIVIWIFNIVQNQIFQRRDIRKLLQKNANCTNYIMELNHFDYGEGRFDYRQKITCKDDIFKVEYENKYSNNIDWHVENKIISEESKMLMYINAPIAVSPLIDATGLIWQINSAEWDYKYIKQEKYKNKQCIVIELSDEDIYGYTYRIDNKTGERKKVEDEYTVKTYKYWIEKDTGIVLRELHFNQSDKLIEENIYNVQANCVTDEDMILPDTDDYTIVDTRTTDNVEEQ